MWIKIRTHNSKSHEDDKHDNMKNEDDKHDNMKEAKHVPTTLMPQPQQQNNLGRLWCNNMSEINDPLDEIFCHSAIVPDLKWMVEEMPKLETVGEVVVSVGDGRR